MADMPNRQFWTEAALWGAVGLVVNFAVNILDVRGALLRAALVTGLSYGAVYAKRYIGRRRGAREGSPKI